MVRLRCLPLCALLVIIRAPGAQATDFAPGQASKFVTHLPTVAPGIIAVPLPTTTTGTSTQTPTSSDSESDSPSITSTPTPTPTMNTGADLPPTPLTFETNATSGEYFGGIPGTNPDLPIVSILLNLFLVGAIYHCSIYQRNVGRFRKGNEDIASLLLAGFGLARVVACVLRVVWASLETTPAVVFLALVSDNIGTVALFVANFFLTKRMISCFGIRMSLWQRKRLNTAANASAGITFLIVFILNTVGVGLHELIASKKRVPANAVTLVQASALILAIFSVVLVGVLLTARVKADTSISYPTKKMAVFLLATGLLKMISQVICLSSTFYIWKPRDDKQAVLSEAVFYSTGWGVDVLILFLYGAVKVDTLYDSSLSFTSTTVSSRPSSSSSRSVGSVEKMGIKIEVIESLDTRLISSTKDG